MAMIMIISKLFKLLVYIVSRCVEKLLIRTGPKDRIYKYIHGHLHENQCILNIGCGDGVLSQMIRSKLKNLSVVDVDVVDLRHDKSSPNFNLFDGYQLKQYDTGHFDLAILIYVLHHVRHRRRLLDEAMRVAKKILIVEDLLHEPESTVLDRFFTLTHRLCSTIVFQDPSGYVKFWTQSKWFSTLRTYRKHITFVNIPEKRWVHYVDHGMFVCSNELL